MKDNAILLISCPDQRGILVTVTAFIRESVEELIRRRKDVEKIVLARAVAAHLEHRILVYGHRTVVFG